MGLVPHPVGDSSGGRRGDGRRGDVLLPAHDPRGKHAVLLRCAGLIDVPLHGWPAPSDVPLGHSRERKLCG